MQVCVNICALCIRWTVFCVKEVSYHLCIEVLQKVQYMKFECHHNLIWIVCGICSLCLDRPWSSLWLFLAFVEYAPCAVITWMDGLLLLCCTEYYVESIAWFDKHQSEVVFSCWIFLAEKSKCVLRTWTKGSKEASVQRMLGIWHQ